jgi:hydrogenase maturation factor
LASQIRSAADEVDATVTGRYTETTPGPDRPIIITTAFGVGKKKKYFTTSGAWDRDLLVVTKDATLEGTSIIAADLHDKLLGKIDKSILRTPKTSYAR